MTLQQIKQEVEKVLPDSKHVGKMMTRAVWIASQGIRVQLRGYSKAYSKDLQELAKTLCQRCGVDPKWVVSRAAAHDQEALVIEDGYRPGRQRG